MEFTEQQFLKHLNTNFQVRLEGQQPINLELVEVKPYPIKTGEERGMSRFSLFFDGPKDVSLSQASYPIHHEAMGSFDIFLVPVSANEKGLSYEAVFNVYNT